MADRVLPAPTGETSSARGKAENAVNTVPAQGPWPNKGMEPIASSLRSVALRSGFRQRLMPSVAMTSNGKSGERLFLRLQGVG